MPHWFLTMKKSCFYTELRSLNIFGLFEFYCLGIGEADFMLVFQCRTIIERPCIRCFCSCGPLVWIEQLGGHNGADTAAARDEPPTVPRNAERMEEEREASPRQKEISPE